MGERRESAIADNAARAATFANEHGYRLDFSHASIKNLETLLERAHQERGHFGNGTTDEDRENADWKHAEFFGCYLGETLRRNFGGTWKLTKVDNEKRIALVGVWGWAWPHWRVHRRIVDGAHHNVWHYYVQMAELNYRERFGISADRALTAEEMHALEEGLLKQALR